MLIIRKKLATFNDKIVICPENIYKYNYDYIIIASIYYREINNQLIELGINKNKIVPFFKKDYWVNVNDELGNILLRNKHKFIEIPLGHFYSPIPSIKEIRENENSIFSKDVKSIEGIELNVENQIKILEKFKEFYDEIPYKEEKVEGIRYYFGNGSFKYGDAIILYYMLRYIKPKKLIEVGSGFSSCVTLDANELFLHNKIQCTFIEPYPELLKSLIKESDFNKIEIIDKKLQEVEIEKFSTLVEGDILFIDSSHVSKVNSDVNNIIFKILPRLKKGVIIHFHDIFFPFEYPKQWIYNGIYWNEAYLLRAFLQFNDSFEIMFFNSLMGDFYKKYFEDNMPLFLKNTGGSIWLRKIK